MSTTTSKLNITKVGRVLRDDRRHRPGARLLHRQARLRESRRRADGPGPALGPGCGSGAETTIALSLRRRASSGRHADRDLPRHERRGCRPRSTARRRPAWTSTTRSRYGGPVPPMFWLRDPDGQLAHRRPAVELITAFDLRAVDSSWRASGSVRGAPRPRPGRALGAARPLRASRGGRGRPKSGNRRVVSRKNVNSTIRPSETSGTISAHGSRPPSGRAGTRHAAFH